MLLLLFISWIMVKKNLYDMNTSIVTLYLMPICTFATKPNLLLEATQQMSSHNPLIQDLSDRKVFLFLLL